MGTILSASKLRQQQQQQQQHGREAESTVASGAIETETENKIKTALAKQSVAAVESAMHCLNFSLADRALQWALLMVADS